MIESMAALCLSLAIHEGIVYNVYVDKLGFKTVGVGHKIIETDPEWGLTAGSPVEEARVIQLFEEDCAKAIDNARDVVPNFTALPNGVQAILVEMSFQMGKSGLRGFKKMIAALELRDYETAAAEMLDSRWYQQTPGRCEKLSWAMSSYSIPF
jgi:lysozyme